MTQRIDKKITITWKKQPELPIYGYISKQKNRVHISHREMLAAREGERKRPSLRALNRLSSQAEKSLHSWHRMQ